MEAGQDRQADRPAQERHGNDESDDHEAVAASDPVTALRGAVVTNVGAVNMPRTPSSTDSKPGGTVGTGSIGESPGQRVVTKNADASLMSAEVLAN